MPLIFLNIQTTSLYLGNLSDFKIFIFYSFRQGGPTVFNVNIMLKRFLTFGTCRIIFRHLKNRNRNDGSRFIQMFEKFHFFSNDHIPSVNKMVHFNVATFPHTPGLNLVPFSLLSNLCPLETSGATTHYCGDTQFIFGDSSFCLISRFPVENRSSER